MITPNQAQQIIFEKAQLNRKITKLPIDKAHNQIVAEDLSNQTDFPPFDRVAMDGIAIKFLTDQRQWQLLGTQYAGDPAAKIPSHDHAYEIMTGAKLCHGADTIIRYEDLQLVGQQAFLKENVQVRKG